MCINKAIDALNELLNQDPAAVQILVNNQVPFLDITGDSKFPFDISLKNGGEGSAITALTLMNVAFEAATGSRIAVNYKPSDTGDVIIDFRIYEPSTGETYKEIEELK